MNCHPLIHYIKNILTITILLLSCGSASAQPPDYLHRIDNRPPLGENGRFNTGFQAHGSNYSIFTHLLGVSHLIPVEEGNTAYSSLYSGYISAAANHRDALHNLSRVVRSGLLRPGNYWLYTILPSSNTYSLATTLDEAIRQAQTGENPLPASDLEVLQTYRDPANHIGNEWMFANQILPETIVSATRVLVNAQGRTTLWRRVSNPNYIPAPSSANSQPAPLNGHANLDEIVFLDINGAATAMGASIPCFSPNHTRQERSLASVICSEVRKWPPKLTWRQTLDYLKTPHRIEKNFKIKLKNGSKYCLEPNSHGYVYENYCTNHSPKWIYTTARQLATVLPNGQSMCLSMPNSFYKLDFTWDYLVYARCMNNDPGQKWQIIHSPEGDYIKHEDSQLRVTEYKWYLMVGLNGYQGYDFTLDPSLDTDFFMGSTSYEKLLRMDIHWERNGQKWFPDPQIEGPSTSQYHESYFDLETGNIAVHDSGDQWKCLKSNRQPGTKIGIVALDASCSDRTGKSRWYYKLNQDGKTFSVTNQAKEKLLINTFIASLPWVTANQSIESKTLDGHFSAFRYFPQ